MQLLRPNYTCGTPPLWNPPTFLRTRLKGMNKHKTCFRATLMLGTTSLPGRAPLRGRQPPPPQSDPSPQRGKARQHPAPSGTAATGPTPPVVSTGGTTQYRAGEVGAGLWGEPAPRRVPARCGAVGPRRRAGGNVRQGAPPSYCVWRLGAGRAAWRTRRKTTAPPSGKHLLRLGKAGAAIKAFSAATLKTARTPAPLAPGAASPLRAGVRAPALSPQ